MVASEVNVAVECIHVDASLSSTSYHRASLNSYRCRCQLLVIVGIIANLSSFTSPSAPIRPIQSTTNPPITADTHDRLKNNCSSSPPIRTSATTVPKHDDDCLHIKTPRTPTTASIALDSKQSCGPPINRHRHTDYLANLPSTTFCNRTFPSTNHFSLSNPQAHHPISTFPKITHTSASDHATPHPPTTSHLFPTADDLHQRCADTKRLLEGMHKQICEYLSTSTSNSNTDNNSSGTTSCINLWHL